MYHCCRLQDLEGFRAYSSLWQSGITSTSGHGTSVCECEVIIGVAACQFLQITWGRDCSHGHLLMVCGWCNRKGEEVVSF